MIEKIDSDEFPNSYKSGWEENVKNYIEGKDLGETLYSSYYLAKFGDVINPDSTGLVLARTLMGDLENKLESPEKFVVLQSYYKFGDFSTIDLVRLPFGYHKEIANEYINNILYPENLENGLCKAEDSSRFLIAGSILNIEDGTANFNYNNGSGDFGAKLAGYNVSSIGDYILRESGLMPVKEDNSEEGKEYIENTLDLMINHKLTYNFYSELVDFYLIGNDKNKSSASIQSLITMKAFDRASEENRNLLETFNEEIEGFSREISVKSAAKRIKED